MHVELAVDVADVGVHRVEAHFEPAGDLADGEAIQEELQDLTLARSEAVGLQGATDHNLTTSRLLGRCCEVVISGTHLK